MKKMKTKTYLVAVAALLLANVATLSSAQAQTAPEDCSAGFLQTYRKVYTNIQAIAESVKAKQDPTNVPQALFACNRLQTLYPTTVCQVGTQVAHSADFSSQCTQITAIAAKMGVQPAPEVTPPAAKDVTDATPVGTLSDKGVVMKINDAAVFTKLASAAKSFFMIDGKLTDFNGALQSNSTVRCTVAYPLNPQTSTLTAGETLKSELVEEENQIINFYVRIAFVGVPFTVDCSKQVVPTPGVVHGTTLGELKKAFGATATFTYAP